MPVPATPPGRLPVGPPRPRQIRPSPDVRRVWLCRAAIVLAGLVFTVACDRTTPTAQTSGSGNLLAGRAPFRATHAYRPERVTDGVRARNGGRWDFDLSSVVAEGGGIEWDLGVATRIGAICLQADNNDDYVLMVSHDGASWTDAWTAPRLAGVGGLQLRDSDRLDVIARYVRIEPRAADSAYAISELALYGPAPASWPPRFREDDAIPESLRIQRELAIALALGGGLALLGMILLGFAPPAFLPRAWVVTLAASLLVTTALIYRARYQHNTIDDAYIGFQYAKNWISGQGPVFNPGQRVEGYTNFLWLALLAPLWPLSGRDPVAFTAAAAYLTMALACLGLLGVAFIARRVLRHPLTWLLAVLLLGFDDAFVSYTIFALENQLLIAGLLSGLALFVQRGRHWEILLGLSFAAVAMTRPDALLWPTMFFIVEGAPLLRKRVTPHSTSARSLRKVALTFALLYGAYFAWRWHYYGHLLPNTFYLKVGTSFAGVARGCEYLRSYVSERMGVPLLALLALFALDRPWVRWLGGFASLHVAYVVYVGGDFYSGHRFLMALTPLLGLLTAVGLDQILQHRVAHRPAGAIIAGTLVMLAALGVRWGTVTGGPAALEIGPWGDVVNLDVRQMRWLAGVARSNASMVLGDIGCAGFFANLRVIDVYGVVDPKVAHRHVDDLGAGKAGHEKVATPAELLAENPSYIKWNYIDARDVPADFYLYNDFPPDLHIPGLFVRDDRGAGHPIATPFHLDGAELAQWSQQGDAFGAAVAGASAQRKGIVGNRGAFIDTYATPNGDRATGRLRSPPFTIVGDSIRLLVGGGRDPQRLRVELLIDGHPVRFATGSNAETLGRRVWNVADWKDRSAQIEIIDLATEAWGHILVDEIEQWTASGATSDGL